MNLITERELAEAAATIPPVKQNCETCKGFGKYGGEICHTCDGTGYFIRAMFPSEERLYVIHLINQRK